MKRTLVVLLALIGIVTSASAATVKLLHNYSGKYLSAVGGGGGAVNASAATAGTTETFTLGDSECLKSGDIVTFRTSGGKYIGVNAANDLVATATSPGATEKFTILSGGNAVVETGTSIALKASNLQYVCISSTGVAKANCGTSAGNDAYFNTTLGGVTSGTLTVTPTVNQGNTTRLGVSLTLGGQTSGGPSGSTKFRWAVTNNATGGSVFDTGYLNSYFYEWNPTAAGSYKITVYAQRWCQGAQVGTTAENFVNQTVASVTFSAPTGGTFNTGNTVNVRWTANNMPTGNGSLVYFDEATYTTRNITSSVSIANGTYNWTIPSDIANTTKGHVRLVGPAGTNQEMLKWDSPAFNVGTVVDPNSLQWTWTTRLTEDHIIALGMQLDGTQRTKIQSFTYTVGSIINSGSSASTTDRLYDDNKCATTCHTGTSGQDAAVYRPTYAVDKAAAQRKNKTDTTTTPGYTWNSLTGIVPPFEASSIKPDLLKKLFRKWLDAGAQ